ncbi:hypothetical protein CERSUDRAFT_119834 [Gelatoporia subvermispora B]|uniref:Uncharacterized protein n=1 Tax=Ceriporiopsis subvermispora (strain B) TaxID=914234 RepID=M2P7H5_CERS8|nr:hypothetical protein CERSUDRAFT_119834 [Gelatoporia subvermispora B]
MSGAGTTTMSVPSSSLVQFPEVIDVDLISDDDLPNPIPRRRRRLSAGARNSGTASGSHFSNHEIIVLDSDEETVTEATPRGTSGRNLRLISPPPPPFRRTPTPPVPPLPRIFPNYGSFHGHIHAAQPPPPPVIRPNDQPFPFEANIRAPPPRPRSPPVPLPIPTAGAARSHHQPVMGFGGAMIALNRQNAIQDANERQQADAESAQGMFADIMRRIRDHGANIASIPGRWLWRDDEEYLHGPDLGDFEPVHNPWDNFLLPVGWSPYHAARAGAQAGSSEPVHWKASYTHPEKAPPGFTYDFSPSEAASDASSPRIVTIIDVETGTTTTTSEAASSTAVDVATTLICARCLEPLVLGAGDGSEDEQKKRRVWALRCGHMLDGRCIEELMCPPAPTPAVEKSVTSSAADPKGKGKAVAMPVEDSVDLQTGTAASAKGKGKARTRDTPSVRDRKGKAVAVPEAESSPQSSQELASGNMGPPSSQEFVDNSIRSRLRPRSSRGSAILASAAVLPAPTLSPPHRTRPIRPLPRRAMSSAVSPRGRGRSRAKGRGRERKPVVEAEHEWHCPVTGCGRPHLSLKVDGAWKMDESRGAVAIFV